MVALPNITGIHRVALTWRVGGTGPTAVNVMHFYNPAVDAVGLFNALNTNVTTAMWLGVMLNTSVTQVSITPLDGSSATQLFFPTGTKWAGTNASGDYSPATAPIISFKTAKRGRRYRGRLYFPFPAESVMGSGTNSIGVGTAQAAWDTFRAAMKTATFPLHIASYGHSLKRTKNPGGGYTLSPVNWTPGSEEVTSGTCETIFGTMRRRQTRLRQ